MKYLYRAARRSQLRGYNPRHDGTRNAQYCSHQKLHHANVRATTPENRGSQPATSSTRANIVYALAFVLRCTGKTALCIYTQKGLPEFSMTRLIEEVFPRYRSCSAKQNLSLQTFTLVYLTSTYERGENCRSKTRTAPKPSGLDQAETVWETSPPFLFKTMEAAFFRSYRDTTLKAQARMS